MAGNKIGGQKAAKTNKKLYGEDFFRRIGAKGGRNGHTGGFASNRELARRVGAIGGSRSRRTGIKNGEGKNADKDIKEMERILEEERDRS